MSLEIIFYLTKPTQAFQGTNWALFRAKSGHYSTSLECKYLFLYTETQHVRSLHVRISPCHPHQFLLHHPYLTLMDTSMIYSMDLSFQFSFWVLLWFVWFEKLELDAWIFSENSSGEGKKHLSIMKIAWVSQNFDSKVHH